MAGEYTAFAGAVGEKLQNGSSRAEDDFASRLAVENQTGSSGSKALYASLVRIEISDRSYAASSEEPVYELPFPIKESKFVLGHNKEISTTPQTLAAGGVVSKKDSFIHLDFANGDELDFDSKNGDIHISSRDRFQKEVQYKGTSWQRTVLTSDKDSRIIFTQDHLSSVEHNGAKDVFSNVSELHESSEPSLPDKASLSKELKQFGFPEIARELNDVDKREASALKKYANDLHSKAAIDALSQSMRERAALLNEASKILPHESSLLTAVAENQLRVALSNLRGLYGAGMPETRVLALALQDHLKNTADGDNEEEISRLGFEARRGGLLKDLVDNVNKSPYASAETLPQSQAIAVRKSLITMHILSGDEGLKSFVSDLNKRLKYEDLIAPADDPGPFHHGAIILTEDGATRYGGSFKLVRRD